MIGIQLAERGWVPEPVLRFGIRRLVAARLREEARRQPGKTEAWRRSLDESPIALVPEQANAQHYEVPPAFFERVLGPHLKYSCALFSPEDQSLAAAEAAMLRTTCERADIRDGQTVLDLGCGWGSLSLFVAERYPNARVVSVSNSALQGEHIRKRALERELGNLDVVTADVNAFEHAEPVDRVVSVEMFEHARNWRELLRRVSGWLRPDGRLFVHVFCHRELSYPYEDAGRGDWMARHFFTGGMMPSADLIREFDENLAVEAQWAVPGAHYARTAEAWLANLDAHRREVEAVLADVPGPESGRLRAERWRLFFLACAELFAYRGGSEWFVSHYRLSPTGNAR